MSSGFCHCRICQKFTGAPVAVWTAFPAGSVRFINGNPKYFFSSPIAERGFCGECGTGLTYRLIKPEPADYIVVFTATLDNPNDFTPKSHGGTESQMEWLEIHDDLPRSQCDESKTLHQAWEAAGIPDTTEWKPYRRNKVTDKSD